eukprot:UN22926
MDVLRHKAAISTADLQGFIYLITKISLRDINVKEWEEFKLGWDIIHFLFGIYKEVDSSGDRKTQQNQKVFKAQLQFGFLRLLVDTIENKIPMNKEQTHTSLMYIHVLLLLKFTWKDVIDSKYFKSLLPFLINQYKTSTMLEDKYFCLDAILTYDRTKNRLSLSEKKVRI